MNTPSPPDPYTTAKAQTDSNLATATANQRMNMVDQSNPYGTTKYTESGTNPDGTPKFTATTAFSAPQQGIYDAGNTLAMGKLGLANDAVKSLSPTGPDLSYGGTAASLDALNKARLDPQWAQNTDLQESKLANQGITPGTPAYDNAMRVFNQGKNDAYTSANLADYQTSSNNTLANWQARMGLINPQGATAINPTAGNVTAPQTSVAGTNIAGLINSNYQQQSANANAMNGQIAGLVGTGASAAFGMPSMGGLFGSGGGGYGGNVFSNPSYGGGNAFTDAYGGNRMNPLPGLTAADYG